MTADPAARANPLDPGVLVQRARVALWANELEAACEIYRRVLELSPGHASTHSTVGMLYMRLGKHSEAIEEAMKEESAGYREYALAIIHHALGQHAESDAAMERMHREDEAFAYQFACAHGCRGENDQAFHWLERSYELHDSGLILVKMSWMFVPLHSDPRWGPSLEKIGGHDSFVASRDERRRQDDTAHGVYSARGRLILTDLPRSIQSGPGKRTTLVEAMFKAVPISRYAGRMSFRSNRMPSRPPGAAGAVKDTAQG